MSLRTAAVPVLSLLLLFGGCTGDARQARSALALGKRQQVARALGDAAAQFSEAARLDPQLHEAHARLARIRLSQGNAREAEASALRAASLVPRSSYYSELLGRAQLAGQRVDPAVASLEQAITLDPTQTSRLTFSIGVLRERQGTPVEAQPAYERSAAADAGARLPRLALARLYLRAGRLDDAKTRLDEIRARVPAAGSERELFVRLDERVTTLLAERDARQRFAVPSELAARDQAIIAGILGRLGAMHGDSGASLFGSGALGSLRGDTIGDSFGFGGLGLTGTGGGGGTGEAIGLGGLGTIGHGGGGGSAVGYGIGSIGGLGRRIEPTVTPGSTNVVGSPSADVIRRVVRQHLGELRACYQSALSRSPALSGLVSMSFVIGASGAVTTSSATGISDPAVETCLANSVRRWMFPAPAGGGIVRVTYPINFQPPATAPAAAE